MLPPVYKHTTNKGKEKTQDRMCLRSLNKLSSAPNTRNSYTLQLNDEQGTMIPLSKQSEKELQSLLGY
jgi:hypothetical protein